MTKLGNYFAHQQGDNADEIRAFIGYLRMQRAQRGSIDGLGHQLDLHGRILRESHGRMRRCR